MTRQLCELLISLQVSVLEDLNKPGRTVCVANTHLYFHPKGIALCEHTWVTDFREHSHDLFLQVLKTEKFPLKEGTFACSRWAWLYNTWAMSSGRLRLEPLSSFVVTSTPSLTQVTNSSRCLIFSCGLCMFSRWKQNCLDHLVFENWAPVCLFFPPVPGVFQLVSETVIPQQHADWSSSGPEESCSMELLSTFPPMLSACGQPAYTNYVGGFHGCLDYIFIQPDRMQVLILILLLWTVL